MQYLLQSHSQSDVSRRHRGDFNVLIRERHQQPAHPLTTHKTTRKVKLLTHHTRDFGKKTDWRLMKTTYMLFLLMLWTADCGFRVPE